MSRPRVLAVITARGGSKGLPGKNIRLVCGLPLIAWTILAARSAVSIDRLILSSDDEEIIATARSYGCEVPFVRPASLATDTATSIDVLTHAVQSLEEHYDLVILLQPTSPLRTAADIDGAVELLHTSSAPAVVSVCASEAHPLWMFRLDNAGCLDPLYSEEKRPQRRQDAFPVYMPNGALYVVCVNQFLQRRTLLPEGTRPWIMPAERSVDIDNLSDIRYLEYLCSCNQALLPTTNTKHQPANRNI